MKDSFTVVFPLYTHGDPSTFSNKKTHTIEVHEYPERNDVGHTSHRINRDFTLKRDFMKEHHESMIKVDAMRRKFSL